MAETENATTQPTTLDRLEAIIKSLAGGNAAQAATNTNPDNAPEMSSKDATQAAADAAKEARIGGNALAKSLNNLARISKSHRHLDTNAVLDNPRGYLRQKNANGQYVVTDNELELMMQTLLAEKSVDAEGITDDRVRGKLLDAASKGGFGQNSEAVMKDLDVTSGAVLIRTDLEPLMHEAYLREFPAAEQIGTIPSNGLVHTYDVRTAIPEASTLNAIGDFSGAFSNSTYVRQASSNIAIIASPVGIALKLALAVQQSGMTSFNLQGNENLEVMGGITSIARKEQTLLLQGNKTVAAKGLDDEEGLTDANGFDGLRLILKDAAYSITKGGGESYRKVLRRAAAQIRNAGGSARNIIAICSEGVEIAIDEELEEFYRITNTRPQGGVDTNLSGNGFNLGSKHLSQIVSVPSDAQGKGMGYYSLDAGATFLEDVDVVDTTGMKFAYLGSPSVTILELPMGYNNKLSRVFVPFKMSGLVVHVAGFQRKIRVPKQTV